ncbi:MAG: hypothetical protein ACTSQF_10165 [Candidatus Heimdallarchaeaceae archaeon]
MNKMHQAVITYNCNLCLQKRMAIIPLSLNIEVDARGLIELVDTHQCKDSEIKSIILFIDTDYAVRSQVSVSYEGDEEEKKSETTSFAIPIPTKKEYPQQLISVDTSFDRMFLKELTIKDKLRQLSFSTEQEQSVEKKLTAKSPLNFIEISINYFNGIDETNALWWLENIANILEEVVYADENTFTLLFSFLDNKISRKFNEEELVEIDYLCNSHLSIPTSTIQSLENYEHKENKLLGKLIQTDSNYYLEIMHQCLENETKTLHDIIESNKDKISVANFLSIFHTLVRDSLIKLEKLHFFTINR